MKNTFIIALLGVTLACNKAQKPEEKPLRDRLPKEGKEVILSPLEKSMDDLAEATLYDPRYIEQTIKLENGSLLVKTANGDTLFMQLTLTAETGNETHRWFSREGNELYKSEHRIISINHGALAEKSTEEFKFYFEDNGALISSYYKRSFGQQKHPQNWTEAPFSPNELNQLWGRKKLSKQRIVE